MKVAVNLRPSRADGSYTVHANIGCRAIRTTPGLWAESTIRKVDRVSHQIYFGTCGVANCWRDDSADRAKKLWGLKRLAGQLPAQEAMRLLK